jgi:uncharacterized cupin superfamily protein
MRMTVPTDHGVPSHQSPDEDKLFLVLAGSLRFHIGDEFFDVRAGQQIAVAKGDTHGFVNVSTTPAVHLIVTSPARHDELLTLSPSCPIHMRRAPWTRSAASTTRTSWASRGGEHSHERARAACSR